MLVVCCWLLFVFHISLLLVVRCVLWVGCCVLLFVVYWCVLLVVGCVCSLLFVLLCFLFVVRWGSCFFV